ncbi:MAG: GNAT family N-acetyltransferase [Natronospirillum sp.]
MSANQQEDWGYTGAFSDPDGHIWMVIALAVAAGHRREGIATALIENLKKIAARRKPM